MIFIIVLLALRWPFNRDLSVGVVTCRNHERTAAERTLGGGGGGSEGVNSQATPLNAPLHPPPHVGHGMTQHVGHGSRLPWCVGMVMTICSPRSAHSASACSRIWRS